MMISGKPGDWYCWSCQHLNFCRRETCHRCHQPRPRDRGEDVIGFIDSDLRAGDWTCLVNNCGAHNFANRSSCFKCNAPKDEYDDGGPQSSGRPVRWKSGDWLCTRSGCNEHNFASRLECYKCHAPKGSGS